MLIFDCETNGLVDDLTHLKCLNLIDTATGIEERYHDDPGVLPRTGSVEDGVRRLQEADEICAHNAYGFDLQAIQKVYPWFKPKGYVHDTKVYSRLIWTNLRDLDVEKIRRGRLSLDTKYIGSHSLRPWGIRLGFPKDDFDPTKYGQTWECYDFTQEVSDYCMQDVRVTLRLWELIAAKAYSAQAMRLEMDVERIIQRQITRGFRFDYEAACRLTAELQIRRVELEAELKGLFDPWQMPDGKPFVPKRDNSRYGYKAGVAVQKYKTVEFNPGSRDHIANRLMAIHGWQPKEFTGDGRPKVDETVLSALPYPEAQKLVEYLTVVKRLGQLAEGKEAWLKVVGKDGRIHGGVNTNGAVTGRMTHSKPNVAQTPAVRKGKDGIKWGYEGGWGAECRALYLAGEGYLLVGCDAEGLELRMLGHFLARYDGGAFAKSVVEGKKEDGSDAHSINQRLAGLNSRDSAKTLIYAFMYGAGDHKLGSIYVDDMTEDQRAKFNAAYPGGEKRDAALTRLGKRLRAKFLEGLPALKQLVEDVKAAAKKGYLRGLDGRRLHIRSAHSALNTLLQSGGALVMKQALVLLDNELQARGFQPGLEYEFVANVHDEWQIEVMEEYADFVGRSAAHAIRLAGESFGLRVQLDGSYAIGRNWQETH
jgi:DNA polymerase-1